MFTKAILVLVAVYIVSVYGSYGGEYVTGHGYSQHAVPYHGPLAKPVVLKSGYLADTHEVAAAKSAHIATLSKYSHGHGYGGDYGYSGNYGGGYGHGENSQAGLHSYGGYHGPTAIPHVLHNGYIADTHEVAVAKAEHLAAVSKAKAYGGGYGHDYSGGYASGYGGYHGDSQHATPYHGPLAKPVVLKSGYLADTHEVAAAKEHHLHTLHSASHHGHYDSHY